jgi:hypothetical protein
MQRGACADELGWGMAARWLQRTAMPTGACALLHCQPAFLMSDAAQLEWHAATAPGAPACMPACPLSRAAWLNQTRMHSAWCLMAGGRQASAATPCAAQQPCHRQHTSVWAAEPLHAAPAPASPPMVMSMSGSSPSGVPMILARSASDSDSLRRPVLLLDRLLLLLAAAAAARSAARFANAFCADLLKRVSWIMICGSGRYGGRSVQVADTGVQHLLPAKPTRGGDVSSACQEGACLPAAAAGVCHTRKVHIVPQQ